MGRILALTLLSPLVIAISRTATAQCTFDWQTSQPTAGVNNSVFSMTTWDPDGPGPQTAFLIVGGLFTNVGGSSANKIAAWDGTTWTSVGGGMLGSEVDAFSSFQGSLIAGGSFVRAGTAICNSIARWDGSHWNSMGSGVSNGLFIRAFTVFQDNLIVGGSFPRISGIDAYSVASWDGSMWHAVGDGFGPWAPICRALEVYQGKIIAGYSDSSPMGPPNEHLVQWDGSTWASLANVDGRIYALTVYHDELVVGGEFQTVNGVSAPLLAAWNGTTWHSLSLNSYGGAVLSMATWGEKLLIGGDFELSTFDGYPLCHGIAVWDGSIWTGLGSGLDNYANSVCLFRDMAFVGGQFHTAGAISSPNWAYYGPTDPIPAITQQPASPSVCENSATSIHLHAAGSGTLTYQWQKNGQALTDNASLFGTQTDTLVFANAQPADSGPYTCVVKLNNCTQATTNTATLTVFASGSADGDADGLVDARDIQPFIDALTGFVPVSAQLCAYDLTGEGIVNIDDLAPFVNRLLNG